MSDLDSDGERAAERVQARARAYSDYASSEEFEAPRAHLLHLQASRSRR